MFYSGNFLHRFLPRFCLFYSYWKWAKDEEQLQQKLLKAKEMRWSFDDTICCTELVKSFLLHTTQPVPSSSNIEHTNNAKPSSSAQKKK